MAYGTVNADVIGTSVAGYNNTAICFATRSATTDTAPAEVMRIDSSGNLLVGTTTQVANAKLTVNGQIATSGFIGINSSTVTTVATGVSFMAVFRDRGNGGTALVLYENNVTPIIVSQTTAAKFVTTSPLATQIQIANLSGGGGITALSGSTIGNTNLNVTVIANQ